MRLEADALHRADEVAQMRLVDGADFTPVASGEAGWAADGARYKAEIPFDVSAVPDSAYILSVRNRTATGRWGPRYQMWVRVSHVDYVSISATPAHLIVGDAGVAATVTVTGAIPGNVSRGALRVTVDGVVRELTSPAWGPYDWHTPAAQQTLQFTVPGGGLTLGTHDVVFQLLDTLGRPLGESLTRSYTVSDFSGSLSVPSRLVIRRPATGTATALAPKGFKLERCHAELATAGQPSQGLGSWCDPAVGELITQFRSCPAQPGPVPLRSGSRPAASPAATPTGDGVMPPGGPLCPHPPCRLAAVGRHASSPRSTRRSRRRPDLVEVVEARRSDHQDVQIGRDRAGLAGMPR